MSPLQHVTHYDVAYIRVEKTSQVPSKSHIKPFLPSEVNAKLKLALYDWHNEKAVLKIKPSVIRDMGSKKNLSDQIVL